MDLGINGRRAIVCASSRGLGKACALSLAAEGVAVVMNGRDAGTLKAAVDEVRAATGTGGGDVTGIACDVTAAAGRDALLAACPAPDILVNNAGGPPPAHFRDIKESHWHVALNNNMLAPIALIQSVVDGMMERNFGRIVNITSAAVKAPIPALGLSNGARAGLTGFVAGVAREVAARGVTINSILPGPFDTDRLRANFRYNAEQSGGDAESLMAAGRRANPARRFGEPAEFGRLCAFLCSVHAGFINGQNIVVDGGAFPGTL